MKISKYLGIALELLRLVRSLLDVFSAVRNLF